MALSKKVVTFVALNCLVIQTLSIPLASQSRSGATEIIEFEPKMEEIPYEKGLSLSCIAKSDGVLYWSWFKDGGRIMSGHRIADDSVSMDRQSSRLWLKPTDDVENSYICVGRNISGDEVRHTFNVSQRQVISGRNRNISC